MCLERSTWLTLIASAWLTACVSDVEPSQHETALVAEAPDDDTAPNACSDIHEQAAERMSAVKVEAATGCATHQDCLLAFASTHCTSECTVGVPVTRQKLAFLRQATADVEANVCPGRDCARVDRVCMLSPAPDTDGSTPGARCEHGTCVVALVCNQSQCPTPAEGAACCNERERCGALIGGRCEALEPRR